MTSVFAPQQGPPSNQQNAVFSVDASELLSVGYKLKGADAPRIIRVELTNAIQRSTEHARDKANAKVTAKSGKLQKSAVVQVRAFSSRVEGVVKWTARSDKGFPYPIVIESGHKKIVPKVAKVLAWQSGGKWIYRMSVPAWPGIKFASKGLKESEPAITGYFALARDKIAAQVEALVNSA